jgi:hypothetical protein
MADLNGDAADGVAVGYGAPQSDGVAGGDAGFGGGPIHDLALTVISPTPGQPISATKPLVIEVTDEGAALDKVVIMAAYSGVLQKEVVYDGSAFAPTFTNNTNAKASITSGFRFTLLRDGGWPGSPTITVVAGSEV